jgi:DUF4097 and DUF4098 domain-containing protein YvlB
MKKYFGLLWIALFAGFIQLAAQTDKTPFLTKNFDASVKNVKVQTSGGGITVEGITSGQTRIEMYVTPNNRNKDLTKDEIQNRLEKDYAVEIITNNQQVSAIVKPKNRITNWQNELSISFKLYTPTKINTDLHTSGGSISLSNVDGNLDFKTSGGSLHLDHVAGEINGKTSGGSINVSDAKNNIDLSTSGGSISAKNCTGKITLNTSGGSLNLKNLNGDIKARTSGGSVHGNDLTGDIDAHTSGGNIDFENISGSMNASTSGGNIDIDITKLDKFLTLRNSGGSVHVTVPKNQGLDLDLRGDRIRTKDFANFSGSVEDDEIKGKLNGGGAAVTIKGSGNVSLAFK